MYSIYFMKYQYENNNKMDSNCQFNLIEFNSIESNSIQFDLTIIIIKDINSSLRSKF